MANASLAAFKRTVTVTWPKQQEAGAKAHLLKVAREGHAMIMAEQQARAGVAPTFDAYANTPGKPIEEVVLPGPIVYRYHYAREVVIKTLQELEAASPVISGDYKRGHTLFINGAPVQNPREAVIKARDEVMIVNTVPYARKIEVGKTESGRAFVLQVPNRIYERVGKKMYARYGKAAKISVQFVNLSTAYRLKKGAKVRRKGRTAGSALTYPAIIIEPLT